MIVAQMSRIGQAAEYLDKYASRINQGVEFLIGILMILLTLVVSAQVFYRYALRDPLPWSAEVARYVFIAVVFFGLSSGYRWGEHIGFTVLHNLIGERKSIFIRLFIHLAVAFLMAVVVYYGIEGAQLAHRQTSPGLKIRMSLPYALLPIGGILVLIQLVPALLKDVLLLAQNAVPEIKGGG